MGGHRKRVLEPHRAFIAERISQTPHLTLHGLKEELAARSMKGSHDTEWRFLRREGCGSKKTLFALEQARTDIARRWQRWRSWQCGLDPTRLVFIGETWIKTGMAPLCGWGPRGRRLASSAGRSTASASAPMSSCSSRRCLAQKRTIEETWGHIGHVVSTIEPAECSNYLTNVSYASIKTRKT
jgi:hypothetical protein